jgi:propanediol dehydratase small subunit
VSNRELLDIYEALQPGRVSYGQLLALAERVEHEVDAPLTAALTREAADTHLEQGIFEVNLAVRSGPDKDQ